MTYTDPDASLNLDPAVCDHQRIMDDYDFGRWCFDCNADEPLVRYCAICGEPEGSTYAHSCCTDDQMIEG